MQLSKFLLNLYNNCTTKQLIVYSNTIEKHSIFRNKQVKKIETILQTILPLLVAAIGILALRLIFDNDSDKIISNEGREMLKNKERMSEINKQINESQSNEPYNEVLIH